MLPHAWNLTIFVLKVSKLSLSVIFGILGIELLLVFLLESVPSSNGVRSSLDVVMPTMPPKKGNVFKRE